MPDQRRRRKPRHEQLAPVLLERLRSSADGRLPTVRALAEELSASSATVSRAVGLLSERGHVEAVPGRGIVACGRVRPMRSATDPSTSVGRFVAALEERIAAGTYQAGRPLPKFDYFVENERVSRDTVLRALRILQGRKLVSKAGRSWVAGTRSQPRWSDAPSAWHIAVTERPVCLILTRHVAQWEETCVSERTRRFCETFQAEIDRCGMRTQLVLAPESEARVGFPSGRKQVGELLRSLGDRYAGTLIVLDQRGSDEIAPWATWLGRLRRPTVLFDRNDSLRFEQREVPLPGKLFFRCHFDEQSALATAASVLGSWGHRCAAVPNYIVGYREWVGHRIDGLRRAAAVQGLELDVVDANFPVSEKPFLKREALAWLDGRIDLPADGAREDIRGAAQSAAKVAQRFSDCIHVVAPVLGRSDVTAMVLPNDDITLRVHNTLIALGVRVPADISMVSFDNSPLAVGVPVSTIDFGFDYLGYCAAHLLIDDIAVRSDPLGNVPARSRLVDRGSVGRPRTSPLHISLPPSGAW